MISPPQRMFAGRNACSLTMAMVASACIVAPASAQTAGASLTYRYGHHLFTVNPAAYPQWRHDAEVWLHNGKEVAPLQEWRVDGDAVPPLPAGVSRSTRSDWNRVAIADTIRQRIAVVLDREPGVVTISQSGSTIAFDGVGLTGRRVRLEEAATLTIEALERGVADIHLAVQETQPSLTIEPALQERGIREVVTVGESNFTGSPANRRHNIAVGLARFNGHIIPQGSVFSFNEVLGPVTAATGYKPELVIMGDKTLPDYGGGLCQVSTTAYRGIWEKGFPIEERRNHSFAVAYYGPHGTDATIYPPATDMKFRNDSPGDLLMQTHMDGDDAYFIYYGTRDARVAEIVGPYTWGHTPAPPERVEYTTDIPEGTRRKVGSAVPGLRAAWFRVVRMPDAAPNTEGYYSFYEARPLYNQIGIAPGAAASGEDAPTWLDAPETPEEPGEQPAPIVAEPRLNPRALRAE